MSKKQHTELQLNEVYVFTDLLSGVTQPTHENLLDSKVQLIEEPVPMYESCKLEEVYTLFLACN
jgi:hypothetical protein